MKVDCSAMGEVWLEMRDARNHPNPGYGIAEAVSIDRNHIAAPVRWQERDNEGEFMGRPVRLHFKLRGCKLYTFQFMADE